MKNIRFFLLLIIALLCTGQMYGQKFTISGTIKDATTGDALWGASVRLKNKKIGISSNQNGVYSLSAGKGPDTLICSFMGYTTFTEAIHLDSDKKLNIQLELSSQTIGVVLIKGEKSNSNVTKAEMSVEKINMERLTKIPALMGEVDVIKAIQMLPGVQSTSEGTSSFSVRGSSPDQNLILLDEATIYNASHMLGFFSVFNNDAVKDVVLYKGDLPLAYGGRLASLLKVNTLDGNVNKWSGKGGIGLISSRLTLTGPVIKDKTSILVSGRRTYMDLFLPLTGREDIKDAVLYFYDLNAKIHHRFNDKNNLFISAYNGKDVFGLPGLGFDYKNQAYSAHWNHIYNPKLFSNIIFYSSIYNYSMRSDLNETMKAYWNSRLLDNTLKADFHYFLDSNNTVKFGIQSTYYINDPGKGGGIGENSLVDEFKISSLYSLSHSAYVSNEQKIGERLTIKYGLRYTLFQNQSNGDTLYTYDKGEVTDTFFYKKNTIYNHIQGLEPRLGLVYEINDKSSVKASYTRNLQLMQLASNSAAGSPLDIWFPANIGIKPQFADQFALGYFRNFLDNLFETSTEVYYKHLQNVIDFKDHASLLGNKNFEQELRFGKGYTYGLELMIRKNEGRLSGWISYAYSRSFRTIAEINNGKEYSANFDKPHSISIVLNFEIVSRLTASANWVYSTGIPATFPTGKFEIDGSVIPIYSERNGARYPDYHRLDLSLNYEFKSKLKNRYHHEINFSIYNAYGRKNPWIISFKQEENNPSKNYAEMTYLFSMVPSITYNFKF